MEKNLDIMKLVLVHLFGHSPGPSLNQGSTVLLQKDFFNTIFLIDFFAALKPPYKLFFRVKFYSVDPSTLHEEITR